MNTAVHLATGPHGPHERGIDGEIQLKRAGSRWFATLTFGDVTFTASADENAFRRVLAPFQKNYDARDLAQIAAKAGVLAKVAGVEDKMKEKAAANLYTRLSQRDPTAWKALQAIIARAKAGEAKAVKAWKMVLRVHTRAKSPQLGWGSGTSEEMKAASRLYDRINAGDQAAWAAMTRIAQCAEADPKCGRAFGIYAEVCDARDQGVSFGALPIVLSAPRVEYLKGRADAARLSIPPVPVFTIATQLPPQIAPGTAAAARIVASKGIAPMIAPPSPKPAAKLIAPSGAKMIVQPKAPAIAPPPAPPAPLTVQQGVAQQQAALLDSLKKLFGK